MTTMENMLKRGESGIITELINLPLTDCPMLLAFDGFLGEGA